MLTHQTLEQGWESAASWPNAARVNFDMARIRIFVT